MEVSPVASVDMDTAQADEHMDIPLPDEDNDDILFGDAEDFFQNPGANQVWEVSVHDRKLAFAQSISSFCHLGYD